MNAKTRTAQMKAALAEAAAAKKSPPQPPAPAPTPQGGEVPKTPSEVKKPKPSRAERLGDKQTKQGRLPHWSAFHAVYDENIGRWEGTLSMTLGGEEVVFRADSSGVWKLMSKLDALYRKHLQSAK